MICQGIWSYSVTSVIINPEWHYHRRCIDITKETHQMGADSVIWFLCQLDIWLFFYLRIP